MQLKFLFLMDVRLYHLRLNHPTQIVYFHVASARRPNCLQMRFLILSILLAALKKAINHFYAEKYIESLKMLFLHFKGLTSNVYNGNFFNGKTIPVYFSIICCMISFYVACSIKQQTR